MDWPIYSGKSTPALRTLQVREGSDRFTRYPFFNSSTITVLSTSWACSYTGFVKVLKLQIRSFLPREWETSHEAGSVYAAYCLYTRQQASSFITLYNHKKRGLRKIEAFRLCQIIENMQIDAHEIWDYKPYDMYLHKILKQPNNLEHISLPPRFSWRGCCRRRWYVVLQSAHCAHLNVVDTCKITKRRAQHSGNSELFVFQFFKKSHVTFFQKQ